MITIVYSSQNKSDEQFENDIKKSIGIRDFQILRYQNNNQYSLTEVYNKGLSEAKNDIIVFCHNDILFETQNWGRKLLDHFNNDDFGILGVAGTTTLDNNGMWWQDREKMIGIVNHIDPESGKKYESKYSPSFGKSIKETVLVDGVFFAVHRKKIACNFNEIYGGFHFYDISFCHENKVAGVRIGVIFDIRITHKSVGNTNSQWEQNRYLFVADNWNTLPSIHKPVDSLQIPKLKINEKIIKKSTNLISIIIPTKNKFYLVDQCVKSIINNTIYSNYEIIIADTGSDEDELKKIKSLQSSDNRIKVVQYDYYNFAKINNDVVLNHTNGDILLFCNNDILLLNNAVDRMMQVMLENYRSVGTIGIRLHYGDDSVQHFGIQGIVSVSKQQFFVTHNKLKTYYDYTTDTYDVLGNTGAFLMILKDNFITCGGFNENYIECLEDVELNLNSLISGKKNLLLGDCVAYHYESQTRDIDPDKNKRMGEDMVNRLLPFVNQNFQLIKNKITYIN